MGFVEIFLIGVGLSMDAFAVAIGKGLGMRRINWKHALVIALYFGVFQALMPILGYLLAFSFAKYVTSVSHIIAFVLLLFIGAKMIWDVVREGSGAGTGANDEQNSLDIAESTQLDHKELFMLAVATSIDALSIGISLAFIEADIVPCAAIIGVTTFIISFLGVFVGNFFGERYEKPATITGGVVLILIGVKIVLEHYDINLISMFLGLFT